MCTISMVDIASAAAEIRRGIKKKKERKKERRKKEERKKERRKKLQAKNIIPAAATQGGHNNFTTIKLLSVRLKHLIK